MKNNLKIEYEIILGMTEAKAEKRPTAQETLKSEKLKHWSLDVKY